MLSGLLLAALSVFLAPPSTESAAAAPRPGSLDRTFSRDGLLVEGFGSELGRGGAAQVALQPDGKAVMFVPTFRGYTLVRYGQDGKLDLTFGDAGFRSGDLGAPFRSGASAMAIHSDGTIMVAGTRFGDSVTGAGSRLVAARFTPDGALDRDFGKHGHLLIGGKARAFVGADGLAVQPDGTTIVVGRVEWPSEAGVMAIRLGPDGRVDRSFGVDGATVVPLGSTYVNLPPQPVISQGGTLTIAAEARGGSHLVRLTSDGARDRSFGGDGVVVSELFERTAGLAVQPDGRTIVSSESGGAARFLPDGSLDPGFGNGGLARTPFFGVSNSAIYVQPDGAVLLAGYDAQEAYRAAPRDFILARLTPEGALDPSLGEGAGFVTTDIAAGSSDQARDLALLADGRVLLAGGTGALRILDSIAAVRYEPDGRLDASFGAGGIVHALARVPARDQIADLLVDRRGRTVAAGRAGGRIALVRYLEGGRRDPSFGAGGLVTAAVTGAPLGEQGESLARYPDGRLLVGSGSGEGGALLRYLPDGRPDQRFGDGGIARTPSLDHVVDLAVLRSGGILAVGLDAECSVRLARFTRAGAPDPRFGGDDGVVAGPGIAGGCPPRNLSVAVQPGGRILVAGDANGAFLLAYSASGKRVKRFGGLGPYKLWAQLPDKVRSLAVDRAGRIVVAGLSRDRLASPSRRFGLVRLRPDGSVDLTFGKKGTVSTALGPWSEIRDVRVAADGKIVAVGATGACRGLGECFDVHLAIARYDGTGSLDRSFASGGVWVGRVGATSSLDALALTRGRIVAGGWAAVSAQDRQFLLVRLHR